MKKKNLLKIFSILAIILITIFVGFYIIIRILIFNWAKDINQSFINKNKHPQKYDYQLEKYKNYYNNKTTGRVGLLTLYQKADK